ncbi:MAG TPA: hypothetical protein ENH82_10220, partial [bacterium]|nr:hypothetical protein [bacterium]
MNIIRVLIICITIYLTALPSFAEKAPNIPDPLKPWVEWVLHGHEEEYQCIPQYNDQSILRCNWPTGLKLSIESRSGKFEQDWSVNYESWITLPGNDLYWPENVRVNNKPAVVLKKDNRAKIKLEKGNYKITGEFHWNKLPEYLQVPRDSALVTLI